MTTPFILPAIIGLALIGLRCFAHLRSQRPTSVLDDVMKLAVLEQHGSWRKRLAARLLGKSNAGWRPRLGALTLSGVPLNAMISENWPTLLLPGLRKVFHTRMRAREELFKRTQIFPVDSSVRAFEDYQGIGELGTQGWNQFNQTGRVTYDGIEPGWKTRLEHRRFAQGVVIERELMDDNLYAEAGIPKSATGRVEKLADSAAIHREKSAAALFNNAFTDSGLDNEGHPIAGADSVGLCSTAHPATPGNTTTQTNEGTLALSGANLSATRLLMREFTDDRGELIAAHPDLLLVPPELEDTANLINTSDKVLGSANNDPNVNKGRQTVVSWDYLTDATAWFLIDSVLKSQHLVWLDRILPEFAAEGDFDTFQAKYRGYYRFSRGFDAWQWVFGQNG